MIDVRLLRENPELIEKDLEKRGKADAKELVSKLVELDKKIREESMKVQELRHLRNKNADDVARMKASGAPQEEIEKKVAYGAQIGKEIDQIEEKVKSFRDEFYALFATIPNLTHETVPLGRSDEDNVEVRRWGQPASFPFKPRDHMDLGLKLDVIDTEKAAEVSGARFAYLKGDLVMLEFAIVTFVLLLLQDRGRCPRQGHQGNI